MLQFQYLTYLEFSMLPFILKTVTEPSLRLQLLSNANMTLDVHIQTEMDIDDAICSALEGNASHLEDGNRAILREAKDALYKAFTLFLRHNSESVPFLPSELLSHYPSQRYTLILSVTRSYELQDVFQNASDTIWMDGGNSIFEFEGFQLAINAKHHIVDSSAFLVSPKKFTVFMRRGNDPNSIRFYRSTFFDLTQNAPPPFHLNPQEVIETVQQDIAIRESAVPIDKMTSGISSNDEDISETASNRSCPECSGDVRRIGNSFFCLQCDWDDLPPLEYRL